MLPEPKFKENEDRRLMWRLTREFLKNKAYIKCYGVSAAEKNETTEGKWGNALLSRVAGKRAPPRTAARTGEADTRAPDGRLLSRRGRERADLLRRRSSSPSHQGKNPNFC